MAHSALRLAGLAAVTAALLIFLDGQLVLRIIAGATLALGAVFVLLVIADWRRQRVLVEADLREGYLCRYEGAVPDAEHALVKGGLLRRDCGGVQRVDLLPVSHKLHRTNNSVHSTWRQVRD